MSAGANVGSPCNGASGGAGAGDGAGAAAARVGASSAFVDEVAPRGFRGGRGGIPGKRRRRKRIVPPTGTKAAAERRGLIT